MVFSSTNTDVGFYAPVPFPDDERQTFVSCPGGYSMDSKDSHPRVGDLGQ